MSFLTDAAFCLPERVTRFFGNVDYAIETLISKSIAFVHVKCLNDPFDPYYFLETEFRNRAEFLRWVGRHHPTELRRIQRDVSPTGFAAGLERVREDFKNRRNSTYLFSTSAEVQNIHPKENLYLWGDYGFGHRGVAIEFNVANLACDVLSHDDPNRERNLTTSDLWVKVLYKDQIIPLSYEEYFDFIRAGPAKDGDEENDRFIGVRTFLEQTLKTKHTVWQMENEWRLLWSNDSGNTIYQCPISDDSIAGIYLGLCIDEKSKRDLLQTVRDRMPSVPIAQAEKSENNFTLEWKTIS